MSIIRPTLFPDEFAAGYLGRVLLFNALNPKNPSWNLAFLRSAMDAPPTSCLADVLVRVSGLLRDAFVRWHTTVPLRRAIVADPPFVPHIDDPRIDAAIMRHGLGSHRAEACLCPECVEEDIDFHGLSYWRREHQLPGLYWCPKHQRPLCAVNDSMAFLSEPSAVLSIATSFNAAWVKRLNAHEAIGRFIAIESDFASRDSPLVERDVARLLRPILEARGLHVGRGTVTRPLLSDMFRKSFDAAWLQHVFPGLLERPQGAFWQPIDGASLGRRAFVTPSVYLAVFALLVDEADEALTALFATTTQAIAVAEPPGEDALGPTDEELRRLYVACGGNYQRIAGQVGGLNQGQVARRIQDLGLPSLRRQDPADVKRFLQLVAHGELSLNDAADVAGIPREFARSIVQNAFTPANRILAKFEDQRRTRGARLQEKRSVAIGVATIE